MAKKKTEDPKIKAREYQKSYHQRRVDAGMKRVSVWIPGERQEEFDAAVEKLQRKWTKLGLMV